MSDVIGVNGFVASDVTNIGQIASFVARVCSDAGYHDEGLKVAEELGDLAKRIAQHLPIQEVVRLTRPPVEIQTEPVN